MIDKDILARTIQMLEDYLDSLDETQVDAMSSAQRVINFWRMYSNFYK